MDQVFVPVFHLAHAIRRPQPIITAESPPGVTVSRYPRAPEWTEGTYISASPHTSACFPVLRTFESK